jgi:hypothetical protein
MCINTELVPMLPVMLLAERGGGVVECEARQAEGVSAAMCEPDESPYNE